jgi:hypothetical protein
MPATAMPRADRHEPDLTPVAQLLHARGWAAIPVRLAGGPAAHRRARPGRHRRRGGSLHAGRGEPRRAHLGARRLGGGRRGHRLAPVAKRGHRRRVQGGPRRVPLGQPIEELAQGFVYRIRLGLAALRGLVPMIHPSHPPPRFGGVRCAVPIRLVAHPRPMPHPRHDPVPCEVLRNGVPFGSSPHREAGPRVRAARRPRRPGDRARWTQARTGGTATRASRIACMTATSPRSRGDRGTPPRAPPLPKFGTLRPETRRARAPAWR